MALCRYCGATINWLETKNGKKMPVDPELVDVEDCDPGMVLVTKHGSVLTVGKEGVFHDPLETDTSGYVSHFATCPKADQARKPR